MYLFFDTETTGLPADYNAPLSNLDNWPRLVQIAWLLYDNSGAQISSNDYIIRPENFTITEESTIFHGISHQKALSEGVSLKSALTEFSNGIDQSRIIVAHNVDFDEKIVGAELLRESMNNRISTKPKFCTMKSSTDFCKIPYGADYKWPSLTELHLKLFNKGFVESHNAAMDVKACADCFFELKRLGVITK